MLLVCSRNKYRPLRGGRGRKLNVGGILQVTLNCLRHGLAFS